MSIILQKFSELSAGLFRLLSTSQVVFTLMFFAMLMGTFAMFKSLLTFVFKKQEGFNSKAINVMAFMFSFIGTTGIAFMYNDSPESFIAVFGGGFGYFLVLFLVIFIYRIAYQFGEDVKDEKGMFGKGPTWVFLIILATLLSAYLLLGYTGKILEVLNCSINPITNDASCSAPGSFLYAKTYNLIADLIAFLIPCSIIFGIWLLIKSSKNNQDVDSSSHGGLNSPEDEHDKEHAEHVSHLIREFNHGMHNAGKVFQEQSDSLNQLQKILNNRGNL